MQSDSAQLATVGLQVTIPRMPVLQLNDYSNMSWKKSLSVTSQEKNCLFLIREKNVMFFCWKEQLI